MYPYPPLNTSCVGTDVTLSMALRRRPDPSGLRIVEIVGGTQAMSSFLAGQDSSWLTEQSMNVQPGVEGDD